MTDSALRVSSLSKHFGDFAALSDVRLDVPAGEIRGLVGSNGSGKSTFIKILAGYHAPDPGDEVWLWGRRLTFPVRDAPRAGIATIHQDLGLWGDATVLENFGLASSYGARAAGRISWRRERQLWTSLARRYDVRIDPDRRVNELSPAERALVALIRVVRELQDHSGHHLLLLDEPTVSYGREDVERLFGVIRALVREGGSVIFIGHRLAEVREISEKISVLRDGRLVETIPAANATPSDLLRLMLGRDLGGFFPERKTRSTGRPILQVESLSGQTVSDLSFTVREGEILGITGLVGMGQDEVPYLIAGGDHLVHGHVSLDDRDITKSGFVKMASHRVALVPADRVRHGVWAEATATENTTLSLLPRYFRGGRLERRREVADVAVLMGRLSVRPPNPNRQMRTFSGGNQQKLVLGRALMQEPRLLLLHEPTMGVDAGARKEILAMVETVAESGCAVIMFSVEYEELAAMCDRILVLESGRVIRELKDGLSEDLILQACHAA